MKPFDSFAPVQRRDGGKARIIGRDAEGRYPITALVTMPATGEEAQQFTLEGRYYSSGSEYKDCDLINVPTGVDEGSVFIRCYLKEDGDIVVYKGLDSEEPAPGSVIGAKAFRLVVKRGERL